MPTYFAFIELSDSNEIPESLHVDLKQMGFGGGLDTEGGLKQLPFRCYAKQNASESLDEISGKLQQATCSTPGTKIRAIVIEGSGFQVWEGA
ncbi:MAG: hypothetical protein ABJF10_07385 [Chthoniobacter sp.]|uniref:hypothetical protein n=1 Tax=Chthoniobacter sp. TaxID=2510640 RepID=UPI0032A430EB